MKKRLYFAEKEEKAVIDYINEDSKEEKNRIYEQYLKEPFKIMIESILRRYPIHIGNHDIEDLEFYALAHLIEQMVKFDPNRITKSGKKTKAYSYCQTIVRNYFRDHSRKTYSDKKTNLNFDDYIEEINKNIEYMYEMDNDDSDLLNDIIENIIEKISEKIDTDPELKENEIIVGEGIINILVNWNCLFMEETPDGRYDKKITNKYTKNKILFYLKEQTGLQTKDIRVSMKPFKDIYFFEKKRIIEEDGS